MRHSIHCLGALALCSVLWAQPTTANPDRDEVVVRVVEHANEERIEDANVAYRVAILAGVGWEGTDMERIVREIEDIFGQCRVTASARDIHWLEVGEQFHVLDASLESRLLDALPPDRPVILLVDRTTHQDLAYAYLPSAQRDKRGTAWITRAVPAACMAPLIAHELAHILLDSADHSDDPRNLMHHSCSVSNIAGASAGTGLTESQCERIRGAL